MARKVHLPELEHLLAHNGLNISEIANISGVSRNTIYAMINGKSVSISSAWKVINALRQNEIDVSHLESGLESRKSSDARRAAGASWVPRLVPGGGMRDANKLAGELREALQRTERLSVDLHEALGRQMVNIDHKVREDIELAFKRLSPTMSALEKRMKPSMSG